MNREGYHDEQERNVQHQGDAQKGPEVSRLGVHPQVVQPGGLRIHGQGRGYFTVNVDRLPPNLLQETLTMMTSPDWMSLKAKVSLCSAPDADAIFQVLSKAEDHLSNKNA